MDYANIIQILYESEEIKNIPDRWTEALPALCKYKGVTCDIFMFLNENNETSKLMRAILVSTSTGEIITLSTEELKKYFNLAKTTFETPQIDDFDEYVSGIDEYKELYAQTHDGVIADIGYSLPKRMYDLLSKIEGNDLLHELYAYIAVEFISHFENKD